MSDKDQKKKTPEQENEDSPIKPDPETTGPNPQEHMEGPISSIVKKIADAGDEADPEEDIEKQEKEREEE